MSNILIISSSPRKNSISYRIALGLLAKLKEKEGIQVNLLDVRETGLGYVQKVWQSIDDVPEEHQDWAQNVFEANGFIIVSPEYNGGYAPAMKDMLDHFPKKAFTKKAFGIATGSTGALGGMRAAQQLLHLSSALFGIPSPTLLICPQMDKKFDEEGKLLEENFAKNIDKFLEDFLWLTDKLNR